ncbi:MAG: hypothetical protein NT160_00970 [Actinobacteria bacterium]|nr:hypothetical protein [Actinomycetota bacterium]
MNTDSITIDCNDCSLQGSHACGDCLVSFVVSREPDDAVIIDVDEARTIRVLESAGLLPRLRFAHRGA